MIRKVFQVVSVLLCVCLLLSSAVMAADMVPPDGMMPEGGMEPPGGFGGGMEPPGGFGGGMEMSPGAGGGAPPGDGAPTEAAIVITDGVENAESEYEPDAYSDYVSVQDGEVLIEGLEIVNGDYTFNGIVVTGSDSVVRLKKANIRLGVDSPASDDMTGGAFTNIDSGATLYISDSNIIVDGSARYAVAAYNDAKMIVNGSNIESTGSNEMTAEVSEPFSNEALLISGNARANFSIGATQTYYFNSSCVAEGWAALSTDSATGSGLDLYAYNTDGIAVNGGYSTYADTNCRVWLYGSRMTAAEIGCIISKSGQIHVYDSSAAGEEILQYNEWEPVDVSSSVMGGRNAVMIHAPDMMGEGVRAADCGTYTQEGGFIGTTQELVSTKNYYDYGDAVGAYIDYVNGSVFLIRSTSANIDLTAVEMESFNNTLVHTVLNADSMGNFLAEGDGDTVEPVYVKMTDMNVTGDLLHEDYHRRMVVELVDTILCGNIVGGSMESWNEKWAEYGEVNWVVDETFETVNGVAVNLLEGAVWNVTGQSNLKCLTLAEGAVLNGEVTVDGEAVIPEAGVTYSGDIRVTGNYVPEEPEEPADKATAENEIPVEVSSEVPVEEPAPVEMPAEVSPEPEAAEEEESTFEPANPVVVYAVIIVAIAVVAVAAVILKRKKKG